MSRTTKDAVRQRPDQHRDAPFWRFGWWLRHGSKRHAAEIRRLHNQARRARARAAIRAGRDPDDDRNDLSWVYW